MGIERKIPLLAVLFVAALIVLPGIAGAASATRDLPSSVDEGETFRVVMTVSDYGTFAQIEETIPPGFTFVDSTLGEATQVNTTENGNYLFILLGETSFEYRLRAGSEGSYGFSGELQDENSVATQIMGDSILTVRDVPTSGGSGGSGGFVFDESETIEPIMEDTTDENMTEELESEMNESMMEEEAAEEVAEEVAGNETEEEGNTPNAPISPVVTVAALLIAFFVFRKQN